MQRMVEYKYYLSINNAIDRSTCYETAGEARRAAKSLTLPTAKGRGFTPRLVKAEKVMILEKTKIKSERIGCL